MDEAAKEDAPPKGCSAEGHERLPQMKLTSTGKGLLAVGGVIVVALWLNGIFDEALEPWGLNVNECSENVFGSVVCGDELDRLRGPVKSGAEWAEEEEEKRQAQKAAEQARERQWEEEASRRIAQETGEAKRESERVASATFPHWDEREPARRAARAAAAESRRDLRREAREVIEGLD